MTRGSDEVARLFDVTNAAAGANLAEEVYPGMPGPVVAESALRVMTWGFPLVLKGKQGQLLKPKPVNNARTDKLTGGFWRHAFANCRCLIPLTAYAEAEGPKGGKTRTWMRLPLESDAPGGVAAAAGVWRPTAEWGDAYAMVITDAAPTVANVHHRMPVLLAPQDWQSWLNGDPATALSLCRPWPGEITVEKTQEAWVRRG